MVGWEGKGFKKQSICRKRLHSMSGENLVIEKSGKRHCRACKLAKERQTVYVNGVRGEYREIGDSYYEIYHPDTGCREVSDSCFTCPLAECKYDDPEGFLAWKREKAALEIIDFQADGYTNLEICAMIGVTKVHSLKNRVKLAGYAWEGGPVSKEEGLPKCNKNKHVLTEANIYITTAGYKRCNACRRDWDNAKWAKTHNMVRGPYMEGRMNER